MLCAVLIECWRSDLPKKKKLLAPGKTLQLLSTHILWCHCILWLCVCRCHNREKNIPLTSKWTMASAVLVSPFSIYDLNMAWTGSADMLILAHLDISDGADAFRTSDSRSKYGSMISSVVLSVFLSFFKPVSTELLTSGSLCWWGNECLIRWMERTDVLSGFRMSLYPYRCLLAIIIVIAIHTVSLSFMLDCLVQVQVQVLYYSSHTQSYKYNQ